MKKLLLFCFLFFTGVCSSLATAHDLFLWEVSHARKPGKIYLGGTIHAGIPSLFPLDSKYDELLMASNYLVLEIYETPIQKKISEARVLKHMMQHALLPDSLKLQDILQKKRYQQYRDYAFMLNIPKEEWEGLQYFKPSLLAVQLDTLGIRLVPHCSLDIGIDNVFKEIFRQRTIRALESTMQQMQIVTGMSDKEALLMLDHITRQTREEVLQDMQKMFRAYLNGNARFFLENTAETAQLIPNFYKALNADRNQKMAQKIVKMLDQKETGLIMIGLAHLLGGESLCQFLQQEGCTVRQLPANGRKGCLTLLAASRLAPQFYRFQSEDLKGKWQEDPVLTQNIKTYFTFQKIKSPHKVYSGKARKIRVTDTDGNHHYWGVLSSSENGESFWFNWQDYSEKEQKINGGSCYQIIKWDSSFFSEHKKTTQP